MYKRCVIDTLQQYFVLHEHSMILKLLNISRHSYSVIVQNQRFGDLKTHICYKFLQIKLLIHNNK